VAVEFGIDALRINQKILLHCWQVAILFSFFATILAVCVGRKYFDNKPRCCARNARIARVAA
jgi:hypothetical protein